MRNAFERNGGVARLTTAPASNTDDQRSSHVGGAPTLDEPTLDLRRVWLSVVESRRLVLAVAITVIVSYLGYTLTSHMYFHSEGSLYLGDAQQNSKLGSSPFADIFGGSDGEVATELEILKSRSLLRQAILDSGFNAPIAPAGRGHLRFWKWWLSGRDLGLLTPLLVTHGASKISPRIAGKNLQVVFAKDGDYELLFGARSLGHGHLGRPFFSSEVELTISPFEQSYVPPPGMTFETEIVNLQTSYERLIHTTNKFVATVPKDVARTQDVAIVRLEFNDGSPFMAAAFLDRLMHAYLEQHLNWKTEEAAATEAFVNEQMAKIRESLERAERRLTEYKTKTGVVVLDEEAKARIDQLANYEKERTAQRLQVHALMQIESVLKRPNAPVEAYLLSQADDPVLTAMSGSLSTAEQELKRLQEQFTADAPAMKEQLAIISKQRDLIGSYIANKRARANEVLRDLEKQIESFDAKLKTLPEAELATATFVREIEVFSKLYTFLLEKQEEAQLSKASTISKTRILDPALLPIREDKPRFTQEVAIALVFGLLLGLVAVYLKHVLAHTFQSEAEMRRHFPETPVFGTVPHRSTANVTGAAAFQTVFEKDLRSGFAEAYRLLRTNLYYSATFGTDKIVLLTSPTPGDGKTLTTLNLAHTLALDGKKVLVIDGDLRKPSHHHLLNVPQHPGLTSVLNGEKHCKSVVRNVFAASGRVDSITTGIVPPNPAELLSSTNLTTLLKEAQDEYDFVLVDSSPFPIVSDALVWAMYADRVLSVFRIKNTRRGMAAEHLRNFASVCRIYGIVINDVMLSQTYGYGYGYEYGYNPQRD